jgi:hypothetical protein
MVLASHHSLIFFSARSDGRIALRRMVKPIPQPQVCSAQPRVFHFRRNHLTLMC